MRPRPLLGAALGFAVSANASGQEIPETNDRYASLAIIGFSVPLDERTRLSLAEYASPELGLTVEQIDVGYALSDQWGVGGGYLRVDSEGGFGENLVRAYAIRRWTDGRWSGDLRALFERRIIEDGLPDRTRYRGRAQIAYEAEVLGVSGAAFVWAEPFYDFRASRWDRLRVATGIRPRVSEHVSLEFSYLRQNDEGARNLDVAAIGIRVGL